MSNLVYDILESRIKKEIDKGIENLGIKTYDISIDADIELNIKIVLVPSDEEIKIIS
ncbi:MAG: hypothetical protein ACOYWZ_18745 [Bacillota bacterium]